MMKHEALLLLGVAGFSVRCGGGVHVGDLGGSGAAGTTSGGTGQGVTSGGFTTGAGGGSTSAGGSAGSSTGTTGSGGSSAGSGPANGFQGSWKGYVENFQFIDQSDAVLLAVTSDIGAGQITFGSSAAPPAATDPNVGYPPGAKFTGGPVQFPYPGFAFALTNVIYDGQRLQFDVDTNELWKHWCELQTPIRDEANAGGGYFCVHNWGSSFGGPTCSQMDPMTHMSVPIDCGKLSLCEPGSGVCTCDMQGCTVQLDGHLLHFDMMIAPPKADGSVRGLDSNLHNVHLSKQ
jgi:hypothetical protein